MRKKSINSIYLLIDSSVKRKISIVDDNEIFVEGVKTICSELPDIEILEVMENMQYIKEHVQAHSPDILILSYNLIVPYTLELLCSLPCFCSLP